MHFVVRRRPLMQVGAVIAVVGLVYACTDHDPVSPSRVGPPVIASAPPSNTVTKEPGPDDPPASFGGSISIDTWLGKGRDYSNGRKFKYPVVYTVEASGTVTGTPTIVWDPPLPGASFGAPGHFNVSASYNGSYTSYSMPGGPIAVTFLKNDSLLFVDMANGPPVTIVNGYLPGGGRASCGPAYAQYCVSYSGTINYTFHRDEAQLTLSVDSETVSTGSVVTFTAGVTPTTVSGLPTPISFDTTTWIPDADSSGGDYTEAATLSAGVWVARKYQRTIIGGGTLRVVAHVNGIRYVGDAARRLAR